MPSRFGVAIVAASCAVAACGKSAPRDDHAGSAGSASGSAVGSLGSGAGSAAAIGYDPGALGALHVDVTGGTPDARQHFTYGLLALHSFWYDEAQKQFQAAVTADPSFAMAYWGLAMSHAKLLWNDDDIAAGQDALKRMPSPDKLPPHEQAWVVAALSLFRRASPDVHASRLDFVKVMEQLDAKFPDDESKLFLALGLLSTLRPNDPDELRVRLRAGQLASDVFAKNPKHPGAAHYMIHAYDTPALADKALAAAEQYAAIAPAAFHARHMPAHIFVRLGRWKDAVTSCQAAWDASVAWVKRDALSIDHEDFHSLAWLIELAYERGRRGDADKALATYADAVRAGVGRDKRAAYANQVTSVMARTDGWAKVDELLKPLEAKAVDGGGGMGCGHPGMGAGSSAGSNAGGSPGELFERRAVLYARAQAAAHLHDVALLTKLLAERDAVDAQLHPFLVATQPPELVASADALRPKVRAALLARAKSDDRALVEALRPLATDQEQEFAGEGTAGGLLQQEQIGEALLRVGRAKDAVVEFRTVLGMHVGRARSLLGAARAAAKAGDAVAARDYYEKLLAVWSEADADLDGLAEARRAVGASR